MIVDLQIILNVVKDGKARKRNSLCKNARSKSGDTAQLLFYISVYHKQCELLPMRRDSWVDTNF